jgi:MFS transporter, PAT family, beta-lactamase induction signal transducer AmpG
MPLKLSFFCLLYFLQGSTLAYVINFQKPYLAAQGVSKETLGFFTSLLIVPFILKVFMGYVSDRFPMGRWGSRKPYMILALVLFTSCFLLLSQVDPGQDFFVFGSLMLTAALGLAWFDACADGWAVDVASSEEQGPIQAAMVAGKAIGMVAMSVLFGWLATREGFSVVFLIIAMLATLVIAVIALTAHQPRQGQSRVELMQGWKSVWQPFYIFFAVYAVLYAVASMGTEGLLTLHFSETKGANSADIGSFGMFRGIGSLVGAVMFALLRPRLGGRWSQWCAAGVLALGCLSPLLELPAMFAAVIWGFAWGFQETAFVTLAMRLAQGRWAATIFAGSMIFANIGNALGEALGAPLVPQIGFSGVFVMFAVLALSTAVLVPLIYRPLARD